MLVYTATLRLLPWLPQAVTLVVLLSEPCRSVRTLTAGWTCHSPSSLAASKYQQTHRQIDISTTAVLNRVNWPSHLKRLSTLNRTHSPQPPSVIKLVFVEATLTVPEHTGVLFCTEEPLIGLPSGVTHQQYPV